MAVYFDGVAYSLDFKCWVADTQNRIIMQNRIHFIKTQVTLNKTIAYKV